MAAAKRNDRKKTKTASRDKFFQKWGFLFSRRLSAGSCRSIIKLDVHPYIASRYKHIKVMDNIMQYRILPFFPLCV